MHHYVYFLHNRPSHFTSDIFKMHSVYSTRSRTVNSNSFIHLLINLPRAFLGTTGYNVEVNTSRNIKPSKSLNGQSNVNLCKWSAVLNKWQFPFLFCMHLFEMFLLKFHEIISRFIVCGKINPVWNLSIHPLI